MKTKYYRCHECYCIFNAKKTLRDIHPFDKEAFVYGCPNCLCVDTLLNICDEPYCKKDASCGTPTVKGYRNTCFKHRP